MTVKNDWTKEAAAEILAGINPEVSLFPTEQDIISLIERHCPFKRNTVYVPMMTVEPGNIQDWATVAASYVHGEGLKNVSRTAAVIATFAKPLMDALEAAKRPHHKGYNDESSDYPPCPCSHDDSENEKCTCGAAEWNSKIDAVLRGAVNL